MFMQQRNHQICLLPFLVQVNQSHTQIHVLYLQQLQTDIFKVYDTLNIVDL